MNKLKRRRIAIAGILLAAAGLTAVVTVGVRRLAEPAPVVVSGWLSEPTTAYVAVQSGLLGSVTETTIAETNAEPMSGFELRANISEEAAHSLFVYASEYGWGKKCAYIDLPPLRWRNGSWVVAKTRKPVWLNIHFSESAQQFACH